MGRAQQSMKAAIRPLARLRERAGVRVLLAGTGLLAGFLPTRTHPPPPPNVAPSSSDTIAANPAAPC